MRGCFVAAADDERRARAAMERSIAVIERLVESVFTNASSNPRSRGRSTARRTDRVEDS